MESLNPGLRLIVGVLLVFVVAYLVQWLVRADPSIEPVATIAGGSDVVTVDVTAPVVIWKRWDYCGRPLQERTSRHTSMTLSSSGAGGVGLRGVIGGQHRERRWR